MKTFTRIASVLIAVFYLYIIIQKVWYHSTFNYQLIHDPVLQRYANTITIAFPAILLLVAILLCLDKNINLYRPNININTLEAGLVSSFILLCLLATYFYVLPHFYKNVGCSCIGIVSTFSWQGNFYTTLSILAINFALIIILSIHDRKVSKKKLVATNQASAGAGA